MGMVDIHCHLLPAVDDGSKSWDITLEMCRMARQDGVTHMVATPHANFEYDYDRDSHARLLAELQQRVPDMAFSLGCDFHLSYDNIEDAVANPKRYTIGDTNYLLIEFNDFSIPPHMPTSLYNLHRAGMRTIITHPERNPVMQRHPELVTQFVELGCLVQITANSLTGFWGSGPKKMCESLLKKGMVAAIASDAHDTKRRTPLLSQAQKAAAKILGEPASRRLVEDNPRAIIENFPVHV